jgi:precorrin-3B C17-methyltransferase
VRNAYRPAQSVERTTLAGMAGVAVDMFTTVFVGSSQTQWVGRAMVTPRGYALPAKEE